MNVVEPRADNQAYELGCAIRTRLIGCEMVIRGLDRKALDEGEKAGEDLFGLDSEFGAFVMAADAVKEKPAIW